MRAHFSALLSVVGLLAAVAATEPRCRVVPVDPPGCETIRLPGAPSAYPPRYPAPLTDPGRQRVAEFLAHYGMRAQDYTLDLHPETGAYDIRHTSYDRWIEVEEADVVTAENVAAVGLAFVERWRTLLGADGLDLSVDRVRCQPGSSLCAVELRQDFCGLPIAPERSLGLDGIIAVRFAAGTNRLDSVYSDLVPLRPVYVDAAVPVDEAAAGLVGHVFAFQCDLSPPWTATVTSVDEVTVLGDLELFLAPAPDDRAALEYRTAWHLRASPRSVLFSWDIWADAFTGAILREEPLFDCD